MKKQYTLFAIPLLALLLICSVMASNYSITGVSNTNTEKVSFNAWHSDGRASTSCSRGLAPQGQGSFGYTFSSGNSREVLNLNLVETSEIQMDSWTYVTATGSGTHWFQGSMPVSVRNIPVSYWFNSATGQAVVQTPYDMETIAITNK